eukprot:3289367-Karenia_brevis.AAC.2
MAPGPFFLGPPPEAPGVGYNIPGWQFLDVDYVSTATKLLAWIVDSAGPGRSVSLLAECPLVRVFFTDPYIPRWADPTGTPKKRFLRGFARCRWQF